MIYFDRVTGKYYYYKYLVRELDRSIREMLEVESIKFVDDLPKKYAHKRNGGRPAEYAELYGTLIANPNKWAEFKTYSLADDPKADRQAYNFVANCRRGAVKHLAPKDGVEVVCVARGKGIYTVFLRYVS